MNYYAVEVFQNIYLYIGHSFHHMAIIIIVLSVKIIAIQRRTDYVNVGTGEHSCNETGASSVLSIIITEQKNISDCHFNFDGASSCDVFIPPSIDIHELIWIGTGRQVLNT